MGDPYGTHMCIFAGKTTLHWGMYISHVNIERAVFTELLLKI